MKDLGFDFGVGLLPHHDTHIWGGGVVFFGFVGFLRKYFFFPLGYYHNTHWPYTFINPFFPKTV